jgi:hypothetical protein
MHRRQTGSGLHEHAVVLDDEVAALDQRDSHLAGEEDMLEIGRVVDARRHQDDLRRVDAGGRDLRHGVAETQTIVLDRPDEDVDDIWKGALHDAPVLDDVGDAGGRAAVVFQHQEAAGVVAHDVGAADMDVGAAGHVEADHLRPVVGIAEHECARYHAVLQDALFVVDVVEEEVECGDALDNAGFDLLPLRRRQHARDDVERQDAVDSVLLGIDGEGDAQIEQLVLGVAGAAAQFVDGDAAETLAQRLGVGRRRIDPAEQLAVVAACVVAG